MMALLENCVGAYLDLCPILNRLDGWSIGVEIRISQYVSQPELYGLCFDSSGVCVVATAGSTLANYEYAVNPNFGSLRFPGVTEFAEDSPSQGLYALRFITNYVDHNAATYFGASS